MLLEHEFPLDVVHCRKAWPYEGEDNLAKVFSGKVTPSSNVSEDESLEREMDETHNVEDDELELRYSLSEAVREVKMNVLVDLATMEVMPSVEAISLPLSSLENTAMRISARNLDDIFLGKGIKMDHVGILEKNEEDLR
ncbi:hypothetical protein V6N11_028584 [Hibiscus sabdariffa]|uniref:Uncharacterized protein n=2 Tax=Hibiscus sabdariffa TaxID=183260 RepID=A0ABR2NA52_9ROSI